MLEQSRTPTVSTEVLRRPVGARGGVVSCGGCGTVTPLATAAIVGVGYRCPACSSRPALARASGSFPAVSMSRIPRRRASAGNELIWIGLMVLVLGGVVAPLLFWWPGVAAIIVGSTTAIIGVTRRNAPY